MIRRIAIALIATSPAWAQGPPATPGAPQSASAAAAAPETGAKGESWTALAIEKSGLPLSADGGPVLSKVEQPTFTRELVRLQWRPGDPIDVYVIRPHGVAKPPVVLYLYNYTSELDRFRDDGWCRRATKDGFAAVGFVSAVSDQRFHTPRPMKQWFVSQLQEALATSAHDVQMILNYMDKRGDVDMKSIGMFGEGSGGAVAILAAAVDLRIGALDVIDPWGDWPDWLKDSAEIPEAERPLYLKPEFTQRVAGLDPVDYLPHLKTRALRVEERLEDPVTPQSARSRIMASVPKRDQLVRYEDDQAHEKAYRVNGLSGWLHAQLRPVPPGVSNP